MRIYQAKLLLKSLFTGKKSHDDFDWDLYTQHYKGELKHVEENATAILQPGDYVFEKSELKKLSQTKPLHLNHHLLYETILQLNPKSVLEIGCGGGDHLKNLHILQPSLTIYGEDLSAKQLTLLHKRHPDLTAKVQQHDITSAQLADWPPVDVVFSQAVIMHIKTGTNHRTAMKNMFRMSQKYVLFMENWRDHNFVQDLLDMKAKGELPWPTLYLSSRPYVGTNLPYIIIASREPLPQYQSLTSDEELRKA
jgi:ubiquinone/menaquinone biosynthesis C-methylase UbiE